MNCRYPIYIPTKGRYESRLTMKAFDKIGVQYKAVIEPQEVDKYLACGLRKDYVLTLPHSDKGLVPTRNWIWDHAKASGVRRFWTFDDNIEGFLRLNRNAKVKVSSGTFLRVIEDFVERYENIAIAGCHYDFFVKCKDKLPPFYKNRRVYSNMLILTDIPYRNEGFYNDDTDLCLRVLKDGWCTVLFLAFLALKSTTMTVKGGMTPHYLKTGEGLEADGRYRMAKELCEKHPDVSRITWKFNRWQHHVDYSSFRYNRLVLRADAQIPRGVNSYGMVLRPDFKG